MATTRAHRERAKPVGAVADAPSAPERVGEAAPAKAKPRVAWIDYVKGLVMIYVVFRHVHDGLRWRPEAWNEGVDSFVFYYHDRFPMAGYFFLSGLFLRRAVDRPFGGFLLNRLQTLVYPYVVWVTLFTLMLMAVGRYTNSGGTTLRPILGMLHDPPFHYWFLYALTMISVVWVGLRKLGLSPLVVLFIFLLLYTFQDAMRGYQWTGFHFLGTHGFCFALGAYLGLGGPVEKFARARTPVVLAIMGASVLVMYLSAEHGFRKDNLTLLAITLCNLPVLFGLGILLERLRVVPFLEVWGRRSLEIYVAHIFGTAGARIVLQQFLGIENFAVHFAAGMVAGFAVPLVLVALSDRFNFPYLFRLGGKRSIKPAHRAAEA